VPVATVPSEDAGGVTVVAVVMEDEYVSASKTTPKPAIPEEGIAVVKPPTAKATPTTDAIQQAGIHTTVKANAVVKPTVKVKAVVKLTTVVANKLVLAATELTAIEAVITVETVLTAHHGGSRRLG